jgi:cytochrome P450
VNIAQRRARARERRLLIAAHPLIWLLGTAAARIGSVVSLPRIGHFVSDPALVRELLGDAARFGKTGDAALSHVLTEVIGPSALVNMDGEPHRRLRAKLQGLFTPHFMDELLAREMAPPLDDAAAVLSAGGSLDLARFAKLFTGRIACALLGIALPPERAEDICLKLYQSGQEFCAVLGLSSRRLGRSRIAFLRRRFEEFTADTRAAYEAGGETTVPGRLRALGLDFEESRGTAGLLFLAGTETTAAALPRIVSLLIETGQWDLLASRRDLLPAAIDEGLRLTTPVPLMTRHVVVDTTLGGKRLRAGERLLVCLLTALRAPAMGAAPRDFDISRTQTPAFAHLAFGHGPHFCLGAALGKRELHAALSTLLDAGPLAITRRRAARRILLPAYEVLEVRRSS